MALQGIKNSDPMTIIHIVVDVPGEKIWIELKLILAGRFAGHVMRTILEQQLAPVLGARRCFGMSSSQGLAFLSFEQVYRTHQHKCWNWRIDG
jgi:hypothetical protein